MAVLSIKMLFRPDFNNVSVEFAVVPSFLRGHRSWSLFGLGRRMFEENLYDAIPSIIELFLYNLQSFHSWAVEGSVFLLVQKHWRSWHQSQASPRWNALGFNWVIAFAFSVDFFFSLLFLMVIPSLWKLSGWNTVCRSTMSLWISSQCSLWMLPVESSRPGGRPSVPIWSPTNVPVSLYGLKRPRTQSSSVSSVHGQGHKFLKVAELPLQKSCQNFGKAGNSVCSFRLVGLSQGLGLFGCPCAGSCSVPVEIRITIAFKNKKIQDTFISFLMLLCH